MTEKQRRFADEYLIDCNASRAYLAVYTTVKSSEVARKNGSRLLTYADVRQYIQERLEAIRAAKIATAQEVMEYLTTVMRGESSSEIVVVEGEGDGCSRARHVKKAPDEKDRLKAAELLGKRFALFAEQVQVKGPVPVIIDDSADPDEPPDEAGPTRRIGYDRDD